MAAVMLLVALPAGAQDAPAQEPGEVQSEAQAEAAPENTDTIPVVPVNEAPVVAAPEAGGAEEPQHLDEIMVTATKRSQSVRDIPSTVNVLRGEKLEEQGARELQDFVDQVPGLQIQDVAVTGSRKIVIRGIAPDNTTNQTVGILLGDVPLGDPIGSYTLVDPDTWDLETVEVLKGPQGSLFGASSLAGIIRYVPNAPELGVWKGKGFAEYVSVKDGGAAPTFGAAVNVPAGNTLAFRFSGVTEHRPGVIDVVNPARNEKDADDARKWSGRAMALWEPTERLTINAWYTAQERKADESFYVTNFDADYTRYDAPRASPVKRSFDLTTLDLRYRFDWATLVSLSAYQNKTNEFDFDGSFALLAAPAERGIEVGRTNRKVDATGIMQELRLTSTDGGDWTWQAGAFYSNYQASIHSDIYTPVPALLGLNTLIAALPAAVRNVLVTDNGVSLGNQALDPLEAGETALFGEVSRRFGDVNLTLGGRLYKTQVEGTSTTAGLLPFATNQSLQTVEQLNVAAKGFSPKFAVAWEVTPDILAYGSVSRGFQYGGVNAIAVPSPNSDTPKTYKSSSLWAYEAGLRTDWLDRTLRLDVTGYYQQWSDAQVSQTAPPAEAYIDNVGDVVVKGVEMSLRYLLPIEGLSLDATGGYIDSKTATEFIDSDGDTVPVGTTMPNAPRLQTALTLAYARLIGGVWETGTGLQFTHADSAWGSVQHQGRIEARDMLNFNFNVKRGDLPFAPTFGVIVNNITDQRKTTSAVKNEEDDSVIDGVNWTNGYTRPRTIILRVGAEFQ